MEGICFIFTSPSYFRVTSQDKGENMADQNIYNHQLIEEFRTHRGSGPMKGRPLLLLTTIGAKSGQPRTTPVMYISDGDNLLVIASNAGAAAHPDWYHNLVAHPEVTVEVGSETFEAIAIVTEGSERQTLWDRVVAQYPFFADHQTKTPRQIPVIMLRRKQ
jgi:deazaflavin-dependent oxidoreductase (nitroreductase family)